MMRRVNRPYRGGVFTESDLSTTAAAAADPVQKPGVDAGQSVSAAESEDVRPSRRRLSTIRFEADSGARKESGDDDQDDNDLQLSGVRADLRSGGTTDPVRAVHPSTHGDMGEDR
jgi:hypothetical protein